MDEFKTIMMTAVPKDADDTERCEAPPTLFVHPLSNTHGGVSCSVLRRKMRSTVRALIMQHRMKDAFAGFNARYDFLRFTDAKIIAPDNQMIVRLHVDQTMMDASRAMRDADELFSPVYEDAVLAERRFTVACCLSRNLNVAVAAHRTRKRAPLASLT